jgi:4-hydroxythreonine-4-phosphate dehydrogenase
MASKKSSKIKVGFSVGDLNGIGMEIILKTLEDSRICELCTPIVYGSKRLTNYYAKAFNLKNLNINYIDSLDKVKNNKVNTKRTAAMLLTIRIVVASVLAPHRLYRALSLKTSSSR